MKHFEAHPFRRNLPSPVGPHPLDDLLTEARRERMRQVLARRCTTLTVVVENCWDPHNATAVVRTCEAFGVHRVHAVTSRNSFRINRKISQGSHLYTDIRLHPDIRAAYDHLREHGFRILASDLSSDSVADPHVIHSGGKPLALVFGNEEQGLSREAVELADESFFIPLSGFTQSLNLSVTVAVSLFSLRHRHLAEDLPGDMGAEQQSWWYDLWLQRRKYGKKDPRSILESGPRDEPLESFKAPARTPARPLKASRSSGAGGNRDPRRRLP